MPVRRLLALLMAGFLALSSYGVLTGYAAAGKSSTVKASQKTVKEMLRSIGVPVSPTCVDMRQVRSNRAWGYYEPVRPAPAGCPSAGEGGPVYVSKASGSWRAIPVAVNATCPEATTTLKSYGASKKVIKALLKKTRIC